MKNKENINNIIIINGPNLNFLGKRNRELYGNLTLLEIKKLCTNEASKYNFTLDFRQTNHEGIIIDWIQEAVSKNYAGIIINAAAYTHTSIAIMDALLLANVPIIEVHITDINNREPYRNKSFISAVANEVIVGEGFKGYLTGIKSLFNLLDREIN